MLLDAFNGTRLNAPNDVVVHPDGGIWFTDPGYGLHWHYEGDKGELELPTRVYRIDPRFEAPPAIVDEALEKPNGLAFSPDHRLLYVADTGWSHKPGHPRQIHVYDVVDGKTLAQRSRVLRLWRRTVPLMAFAWIPTATSGPRSRGAVPATTACTYLRPMAPGSA